MCIEGASGSVNIFDKDVNRSGWFVVFHHNYLSTSVMGLQCWRNYGAPNRCWVGTQIFQTATESKDVIGRSDRDIRSDEGLHLW